MKKTILLSGIIALFHLATAQTAANFTVSDCDGNSHTLFNDLDAGKVVVMVWVMPCGTCIAPAKTAFNAAKAFESSNPGTVLYYLVDDFGNSSCSTLKSWASTNAITPTATFSNPAIKMVDYGSNGMPKVVVLGGSGHKVFLNLNSGVTNTNVTNAINDALIAADVNENTLPSIQVSLFPNPASEQMSAQYTLNATQQVRADIYNVAGEFVQTLFDENQSMGAQNISIPTTELSSGMYMLKIRGEQFAEVIKFSVKHD